MNIAGIVDAKNTGRSPEIDPPTSVAPYIGTWSQSNRFMIAQVTLSCDVAGTLYFDFYDIHDQPTEASAPTSTFPTSGFKYDGSGFNEFHQAVKGIRWFRTRFIPDTDIATAFRINTYLVTQLDTANAPLNQAIAQDADATVVKTVESELAIGAGLFSGYTKTNKLGRNPDIDTGSVPEDVWDAGGLYPGFPTGAPETVDCVSANASDTGTLSFVGLLTEDATEFTVETVTLNGTTPVTSTNSWYRIHSAWYNSGDDTTFNVGQLQINHTTTTANIFIVILAGRSQSNMTGFTIPQGCTGYVRKVTASIRRAGAGVYVDGAMWVRTRGAAPRLRRPFTVNGGARLEQEIYGGFRLAAGTDIIPRVTDVSQNNTGVVFGMDILLVRD